MKKAFWSTRSRWMARCRAIPRSVDPKAQARSRGGLRTDHMKEAGAPRGRPLHVDD